MTGNHNQELLSKSSQVWLHISADSHKISAEHQAVIIEAIATILKLSRYEVKVGWVCKNSNIYIYDFDLAALAVERLRSLLADNHAQLRLLKVGRVILEGKPGELEEWVLREGEFEFVTRPDLTTVADEILVAFYLKEETTTETRSQIWDELKRRYYPHYDPGQPDRPRQGDWFNRRVFAVLLASKISREQVNTIWSECAGDVFEELFLKQDEFERLLRKFDLKRAPPREPFQFWVFNVHLPNAVIDWLRKENQGSEPPDNLDEDEVEAPISFEGDISIDIYPDSKPWLWWDAFLVPKHGLIIRLFHLAYVDLPGCYLEYIARVIGKTIDETRTNVNRLQQCLRPTHSFGQNDEMQTYALEKMLVAEELKSPDAETELDEAKLKAVVAYAIGQTSWKYPHQPPIEGEAVIVMLVEALAGFPLTVGVVREVLGRWCKFLKGELKESQLEAVRAEIARFQAAIKEQEIYLNYLGLDPKTLAEAAMELTLQELKRRQKVAAEAGDEKEEQALIYHERVLRLDRARRRQARLLAEYNPGKHLVTPWQRELADILGLAIGTVGGRVTEAKRALNGAIIWREVLKEIADLTLAISQRTWLAHFEKTCVISFEQKRLRIGYPATGELSWWDDLRPQVEMLLQRSLLWRTVERYGQTGLAITIEQYQGDWPPLEPAWADEASSWIWRIRS